MTQTTAENPAVEEMWDTYRRAALPDTTPPYEVQEYREVFFAGACALMNHLAMSVTDEMMDGEPGDEDLDDMLNTMKAVATELREFVAGGPLRGN